MYMTASWSGHDGRPCRSSVVAGIDDDGQVAAEVGGLRPFGELRAAGPARELDDLHAVTRRGARDLAMRSMVSWSYGAGIRTMTVSKPSSRRAGCASATSVGPRQVRSRSHVLDAVGAIRAPYAPSRPSASSRMTIGKLTVFSMRREVAPDVGAVRRQGRRARRGPRPRSRTCSSRPRGAATVRSVLRGPDPPTRIGRCGLDRPRRAQGVVERVEAALVAEPLAVEQAAHEHHRLVEPVEPLAGARAEVDAVGVVLTLEPGAADAEDGPAVRRRDRASWRAWR